MNFWKKHEKEVVFHNGKLNIIESCVDRHALSQPDKLAFVFENNKTKKYTYKKLYEEVNKFANLLKKLKIKPNSHVALFLPKVPELYISFLGAIKAGCVVVPLFEAFQEQGLEKRLKRGEAQVLITNKEMARRVKRIKKKVKTLKHILIVDSKPYKNQIKKQSKEFKPILKNKKDTALLMFTSSTTGTPVAGIQLPHYGLVQQHFTAKLVLGLKKEDRYWCTAHPGWVTGSVYGILAPLSIGCTTYVYEKHFKAKKFINFLKRNKISVMYTAPTVLRLLKNELKKSDLKSLRNLCSVGEALTTSTFDFYKKKLGIKIIDTYWQTETGTMVISNTPKTIKRGSIGKPLPGIKVKIIKGMMLLEKGWPAMMTGTYKHPKLYRSYFDGKWFKTKDLAKKEKGYFFFKSREDDIIKTSGERVSPIEIESVLMKHKAVKEAAAIGIPHKIKGSIIKAFVVLQKGFKESDKLKEELSMYVKKNYAGHSYPKVVEFIKELPKTSSGKIIRRALRNSKTKS
jgi:acetyl-CoA synthetase